LTAPRHGPDDGAFVRRASLVLLACLLALAAVPAQAAKRAAPSVTISSPADGAKISAAKLVNGRLEVVGRVRPGNAAVVGLSLNGRRLDVSPDMRFDGFVPAKKGANVIEVIATDSNGLQGGTSIRVTVGSRKRS
jgi:Glucodextranase, domain B